MPLNTVWNVVPRPDAGMWRLIRESPVVFWHGTGDWLFAVGVTPA